MAKITIELDYDSFTAQIVNSNRSALGKRGITGGVNVKFSELPSKVITNLLIAAIQDHLQVGLKTLNAETATVEECQKAMRDRLELLKSGAKATRKAGAKDPVKDLAKKQIKKAISDRSEEKLDAPTLTKLVNGMFEAHKNYLKLPEGSEERAKLEKVYKVVEGALKTARATLQQTDSMDDVLSALAERAEKASADARAKREAEAPAAEDAPAETPKPKAKGKARGA